MSNTSQIFIIRIKYKGRPNWYVQPSNEFHLATNDIHRAQRFTMREAVEWINGRPESAKTRYMIEYAPLTEGVTA